MTADELKLLAQERALNESVEQLEVLRAAGLSSDEIDEELLRLKRLHFKVQMKNLKARMKPGKKEE